MVGDASGSGVPRELSGQTFSGSAIPSSPSEPPAVAIRPSELAKQQNSIQEGSRIPTPYDQQRVVGKYIERLEPALANMADEFEAMGERDLKWQTEVIRSLVDL